MPPREVFTIAIPAHQDAKGHTQRQLSGDSQTLFASPARVLSSPQYYAPQGPVSTRFSVQAPTYSGSFPQNSNESSRALNNDLPAEPNTVQASGIPPLGSLEKSPVPPYPSSTTSFNMQEAHNNPNYNPNIITPPVPAYGYPVQSPQPYSQSQPMSTIQAQPSPITQPIQTTQPTPAAGMDIHNVRGVPRDARGEREWSHGCSECFDDCGTCMLGWCCPCLLYSQIQTRLNHLETRGVPHPDGGDSCTGDCFIHGLLNCCLGWGFILQIGQRQQVRTRYRIAGDACNDFMIAWCCTPCEMTQVSREIELEERAITGATVTEPQPLQGKNPSPYSEKR